MYRSTQLREWDRVEFVARSVLFWCWFGTYIGRLVAPSSSSVLLLVYPVLLSTHVIHAAAAAFFLLSPHPQFVWYKYGSAISTFHPWLQPREREKWLLCVVTWELCLSTFTRSSRNDEISVGWNKDSFCGKLSLLLLMLLRRLFCTNTPTNIVIILERRWWHGWYFRIVSPKHKIQLREQCFVICYNKSPCHAIGSDVRVVVVWCTFFYLSEHLTLFCSACSFISAVCASVRDAHAIT